MNTLIKSILSGLNTWGRSLGFIYKRASCMRLGMLFRFYFYTFYEFFQKQGIRRGPPRFRASIMVSLTLSCLTNSLLIPLNRNFNNPFQLTEFLVLLGVFSLFIVYNNAT